MHHHIPISRIQTELHLSTARSGGPGGQHVNKVETKVILRFDIRNSLILSEREKIKILEKLGNQLTKNGELIITAESARTQLRNKEIALKKLERTLTKAFHIPKLRKPTKPSKSAINKRIKMKKEHGEKKKWRQKLT